MDYIISAGVNTHPCFFLLSITTATIDSRITNFLIHFKIKSLLYALFMINRLTYVSYSTVVQYIIGIMVV